ncbi:PREDICTED: uncharacterized protein LOC101293551 [Fragaria vesca subsp. vesca]|uniref:uncharacterized protein LOC101293551 n=1 Tax=Fragaria vesca subsp. vesca TaxID=101020 RepID=UPI0002C30397|nr:PREDICTED: uncharacterized protein LOC101293551 [Fragaria vesca subsp. vesca]
MAGIAIVLDLLRKNPSVTSQSLHASGFFSAKAAASAAAASVAAGAPYVYNSLFGNFRVPVAYCDAGATLSDDYISNLRSASLKIFQNDAVSYGAKEYPVELKPLFSAFELKNFTLTTFRSFLINFLPLAEPRANLESDDEDFLEDTEEQQRVDYVVPLKKSLKQIARDVTVTTTRRILEKISVYYVSQRMAWKLLKDLSKSAMRKAGRRMPTYVFFFSVSKTTMRGHCLAIAASWIISVGIDIYRTCYGMMNSTEDIDEIGTAQRLKLLGNKVGRTTLKCGASLIFASIGAGIGATLFHPSTGQWVGCVLGDVAGPLIVSYSLYRSFDPEI